MTVHPLTQTVFIDLRLSPNPGRGRDDLSRGFRRACLYETILEKLALYPFRMEGL